MLKYISNLYKKNKLGFIGFIIGFIGIIFTIIFGGLSLYYRFYTPQPEISYTILSDSNVVDLHKPLKDLKILFQDEDIQKNNMNLKIYSLKISNSGKKNILETHYASDENWGIKITDGRIIESRLVESNSDYLKSNLNTKIIDDKTINFKKVIFDKNDYFTLEVLVLHSRDSDINLIPFGKISGISKNQSFKKLDMTKGGIFQNILTDKEVDILLIIILFFAIIFIVYRIERSTSSLKKVNKQINLFIEKFSSYLIQSKESTLAFFDIIGNEKVLKVLESDPELARKVKDCISKIALSDSKRKEIEEKILRKQ